LWADGIGDHVRYVYKGLAEWLRANDIYYVSQHQNSIVKTRPLIGRGDAGRAGPVGARARGTGPGTVRTAAGLASSAQIADRQR